MKRFHTWGRILFISFIISCGGEMHVGKGANLDTLPSEPTALELAQAIRNTAETPPITKQSESSSVSGNVGTAKFHYTCPGGGTLDSNLKANLSTGSGSIHTSFNDCNVPMVIKGVTKTETISGTFSFSGDSNSGSIGVSLSLSGDLGLGVVCNLNEEGSNPPKGTCIFQDNSGKQIIGQAIDLSSLIVL